LRKAVRVVATKVGNGVLCSEERVESAEAAAFVFPITAKCGYEKLSRVLMVGVSSVGSGGGGGGGGGGW
jgi:hypothetical protein